MSRPVRLKDIAQELDLSVMTISRALSGHPDVKIETRKLIHQTAKRMRYRPNQLARSLVRQKSMVIGLVVPDISHSYFAEIVLGIEEVTLERGYSLFLSNSHEDADLERREIESFLDRRVDGLIVASALGEGESEHLRKMIEVPCVCIDRKFTNSDLPYVVCDDFKVGWLATEHLIGLGHLKIAHVAGSNVSTARLRRDGYRSALRKYEIPYDRQLGHEGGFEWKDGRRAAQWILNQPEQPSAVFAVNDPVAFGVMEVLKEQEIDVPGQVAIVGAGDLQGSSLAYAPLTTIRFPTQQMGREAGEMLIENVEASREVRRRKESRYEVTKEPELVVRLSCGAGR